MKVKNFKDLQNWTDGPNKGINELSPVRYEVEIFIDSFRGSVDHSIADWISGICKETKLKEYKDCDIENSKKAIRFVQNKDLKYYRVYVEISNKIEDLNKQIDILTSNQDKIRDRADSELLLKFQEELLNKDPEKFYEFFINVSDDGEWLNDHSICDVHPDLINQYDEKEFFEQFEHIPAAKKYNL